MSVHAGDQTQWTPCKLLAEGFLRMLCLLAGSKLVYALVHAKNMTRQPVSN